MPQLLAFSILALILWIGDVVSTRTRSWLPSVFVCAILFLVGYWTFFPEDIVQVAGFQTPIVFLAMYLLITNMGTLLSFAELARQWRTVVVALAGIGALRWRRSRRDPRASVARGPARLRAAARTRRCR